MRRVPSTRVAVAAGLLPSAEHLERARSLGRRFTQLREVTLARAPARHGARVWLAVESMQITGSFKVRGALLAIEALLAAADGKDVQLVAASAGNHGAGVAYAAKLLGATATIVVPRGAPHTKVDKIAAYGAAVVTADGAGYDEAESEAIELARARGVPFLSPYDDLDVLVGNGASLAFEIVAALGKVPDAVYCPIGGGGLATGLACGFAHEGAKRALVWGVQSEASCAFAQSLESGRAVTTLPPAATLAEGLEGGISARAFARAQATLAGAIVATEDELARALCYAVQELGLVLEGSAAIALVPMLTEPPLLNLDDDVVLVLTGRNVDPDRLADVLC